LFSPRIPCGDGTDAACIHQSATRSEGHGAARKAGCFGLGSLRACGICEPCTFHARFPPGDGRKPLAIPRDWVSTIADDGVIAGKRNLRFTLSKNDCQDSALNRPRPNVHPSSPTPPIVVE